MKKIIAVGGEPASGKSTLMKAVMAAWSDGWLPFRYGLVNGSINSKAKLIVLGLYAEGQAFGGTDRLSLGVMPDALRFVREKASLPTYDLEDMTMIFEGDRLFSKSFLEACARAAPTVPLVLQAGEATLASRHRQRGDNQSASWLKGRTSKVHNILEALPQTRIFVNETLTDQRAILCWIWNEIARPAVTTG